MIFLIYPNITSKERYNKDIDAIGGHQLPLGVYYLASYLKNQGRNVDVIDAEATEISDQEIVNILRQASATVVGISSTTVAFRNARKLAEKIKKELPDVQIVIGGPQITAMPQKTMETLAFDYGIVQEGEIAFSMLLEHILDKKNNLKQIPNLFYIENETIKSNPEKMVINNLDTIPFPDRTLVKNLNIYTPPIGAFRQQPVASVITSRGCPHSCIFCDNNTFGKSIRYFSAEYVADEIEYLINNFGIKEISFLDDTFIVNKKRFKKIFSLLKEKSINISWTCMTRVDNLDFETLQFMKDHGCWQIRVGVESGNQDVIDFIKKGITLAQVEKVVKDCKKLKIMATGFFMIGHHIDTPDTIKQTIDFALSIPLTDVVVTINTPIPGTESYQLARKYGDYNEKDWTSLNYWTPVFVPKGLSQEYLLEQQKNFYKRFYLRPQIIYKQISKIRSFRIAGLLLKSTMSGIRFMKKEAQ